MQHIQSNSNTVKDVVEDLDVERLLDVATKDRVNEIQNLDLDLKEAKHLFIFVS